MNVYDYSSFENVKPKLPPGASIKLSQAIQWYFSGCELQERDKRYYISIAKRYIIPSCGNIDVKDFSYLDFQILLGHMHNTTSSSVRDRIATLLASTFDMLQYYGFVNHNCIKLYKRSRRGVKVIDPLNSDEIRMFLSLIQTHKMCNLLYLLLFLPIRIQEILNLKHSDWSKSDQTILVNERKIFLPQTLNEKLALQFQQNKGQTSEYFFTNKSGQTLSTDAVNRALRTIKEQMPADTILTTSRLHSTAIFLINKSGCDVKSIQHILGYRCPKTLLRHIKKCGEPHTKSDMNNIFNTHMQSIVNTAKEMESKCH